MGKKLAIGGIVVIAACLAVIAYAALDVAKTYRAANPTPTPTPAERCDGWLEWERDSPDLASAFPIHWAILDEVQASKEQYRDWRDQVRDLRSDLDDANPPLVLQEHAEMAGHWLDIMDWMLVGLHNNGELTNPDDLISLDYRADQMGILWSDAILECQPSERT